MKGNGNQNLYLNEAVWFAAGAMVAWLAGWRKGGETAHRGKRVHRVCIYLYTCGEWNGGYAHCRGREEINKNFSYANSQDLAEVEGHEEIGRASCRERVYVLV